MENSLATTVVTPSKCVGRAAPHIPSVSPATCTVVRGGPSGYISSTVGRNITRHRRRRPSRRRLRGRAGTRRDPRSVRTASGSRTTRPPRDRARPTAAVMSDRCPAWKKPIVGTSPTDPPAARAASVAARTSAIVVTTFTRAPRPAPRSAPRGPRSGGPSRGTPRARRRASRRGAHAPSRRRRARPGPVERGARAEGLDVLERSPASAAGTPRAGTSVDASTWARSATRWLLAMHAAAW